MYSKQKLDSKAEKKNTNKLSKLTSNHRFTTFQLIENKLNRGKNTTIFEMEKHCVNIEKNGIFCLYQV